MHRTLSGKRLTVLATAGVVACLITAATTTQADGVEAGDCDPSAVHLDTEGQPLTRAERIARMDRAFYDSLARFEECQTAVAPVAARDAGAEGTGTDAGAADTSDGASIESVAAEGIQGTETPEPGETPAAGTEPPSAAGSGTVPEDIPEPDNDSVLEAQIRRAAMEEADPRRRAELWNEYRKYKGLAPKPLPKEDGEITDGQKIE